MQVILPRAIVVLALFSVFFVSGCDQIASKNQTPPPTKAAAPATAETEASKGKTPEPKPASELASFTIRELIKKAESALRDNDVDAAAVAMAEARTRGDDFIGTKLDVARVLFGAGKMKESVEVYDEILELRPDLKPQLWQRGLALYYAEDFSKGVDQFDTHQSHNSQDVENAVWHLLCKSQLSSVDDARKSMIQVDKDTRIPMKQVFDMFAGTGSPEEVIKASGYDEAKAEANSTNYHGWLYVGLFHEMMGDQKASNEAMKTALKCKPFIPSLMGYVADGHLRVRGEYPVDGK